MTILITKGPLPSNLCYDLALRPGDAHPYKLRVLNSDKASIYRDHVGILWFRVDNRTYFLLNYDPATEKALGCKVYRVPEA